MIAYDSYPGDRRQGMINRLYERSLRRTETGLTPFAGHTVQMARFKTRGVFEKKIPKGPNLEVYFFRGALPCGGKAELGCSSGFIQTGIENPCLDISSQRGRSRWSISNNFVFINSVRGDHFTCDPQ
jgi:hypothetical protein